MWYLLSRFYNPSSLGTSFYFETFLRTKTFLACILIACSHFLRFAMLDLFDNVASLWLKNCPFVIVFNVCWFCISFQNLHEKFAKINLLKRRANKDQAGPRCTKKQQFAKQKQKKDQDQQRRTKKDYQGLRSTKKHQKHQKSTKKHQV